MADFTRVGSHLFHNDGTVTDIENHEIVTSINLGENGIGDEGATAIAQTLEKHHADLDGSFW